METKLTVKDLMIGDWVNIYKFTNDEQQIKDLFPAKVISILQGSDTENYNVIECVHGTHIASRPADTCLPVLLTTEMLKKNGFKYNDCPIVLGWEQYGLTLYRGGDGFLINCGQNVALIINYVHQLQHTLRLCGIDKEIVL